MAGRVSQVEAVGLALAGYTLWVLADVSLKLVGRSSLPSWEILALVGAVIAGLLALRAAWRGETRTLWPKQPGRQILRSLLDVANNAGVLVALRHLPLALFYILVFLAPLVTTVLAAVTLGERLEWRKALATVVGLVGVVVAVQPLGSAGDWVGYAACMVCVACFSTNMVWSRVLTQTETSESMTFFSGLVMAVGGLLVAVVWRPMPVSGELALVIGAMGVFAAVGSLCFFAALRHTSAATVSQYHYSQLLTGALAGYLIWRERPSAAMMAGAVLIVGAGGFTAWVARSGAR